ncbi:MAG: tRNA 5'-guanylyltransferase [Thermoproteus sp. AZ2]|uniref:tRNA 5'-guanylyltransferase n=1 Tax=Thermoproteus sp. AZ2 TaxID=1609232 RepID=A0ACC6V2T7_9CREN
MAALLSAILSSPPPKLEADYRSREGPPDRLSPPIAVRLDGVGFGRSVADLPGPRNWAVHNALFLEAVELARGTSAYAVYVVSDEANLIYLDQLPYRGRLIKILSVLPSRLSARLSARLGRPVAFDARAVRLLDECDAARYVLYRARIGLNNYVVSLARLRGLVEEETPRLGELLAALGPTDLSLGWGSLATRAGGWRREDLCAFLGRCGLC